MKKKFLIVLLSIVCALCLAFGLTACGNSSGGTTDGGQNNEQTGNTDDGGSSGDDGSSDDDNTGSGSGSSKGDDGSSSSGGSSGDSGTSGGSSSGDTEQGGSSGSTDDGSSSGDTDDGSSTGGDIEITVTLNYSLSSDGNSYTVSGIGSCTDTDIEIPSTYDGKPVTAIGGSAFYQCTDIVTITIPESVITIGDSAFYGCTSLKSVTIPNSVTTIGASAFGDCTALVTITIGGGVISIGSGAFSGCYKLLEIYNLSALSITSGSSDNGGAAYYAKDVYTSADAESKLSEESDFIFYYDNGAYYLVGYTGKDTDITLPDSVNGNSYEIYDYAFFHNHFLTSVVISDGVTYIGEQAFSYCYSLVSVTIGRGITSLGEEEYNGRLHSFNVFFDCWKLIEVYNLSSLDITAGSGGNGRVAYYAKDVYTSTDNESKLIYKNDYIFYNDDGTYYLLGYKGTDTDITLPKNINGNSYEIYKFAFYYNTKLTSVVIPDSITSISYNAFMWCSSLKSVTIPDSVTTIDYYAFDCCISLESITIPDSVTVVEQYAFANCLSLTNVTIGNGVTTIRYGTFGNCISLTSIIIPDSVTTIEVCAFYCCTSLVSVTIGKGVTSIGENDEGEYAFSCPNLVEVYNLSSLDITAGSSKYGRVAYYAKDVYTSTDAESKLIYEGDYIFYNDDGTYYLLGYTGTATEITLPDSINGNSYAIDDYAFYFISVLRNWDRLTSVTISNGVTSIGEYAFYGRNNLTSVIIGSSVTSIGDCAFMDCASLTSITIPDSVNYIGYNAFYDCTALTSVTFENTSGWYYWGTAVSSSDLADTSTAAEYLTGTYFDSRFTYEWYRSDD